MKFISLSQEKFTMVDDDLFEYLNQFKWCYHNKGYVVRNSIKDPLSKKHLIRLHHIVIGVISLPRVLGLVVDHIDGNKLNNQRANLRVVTQRKNTQNQKRHRAGSLVGTTFRKRDKVWQVTIRIDGKKNYIGTFSTELEAHEAYIATSKNSTSQIDKNEV